MSLIDPINLYLPDLPAGLVGLTIAHLSDFHIQRARKRHQQIISNLKHIKVDLIFLTGDYITTYGDESIGLSSMQTICESLSPKFGLFGVFGNHDTPEIRRDFDVLPVHWLTNGYHQIEGLPLELYGLDTFQVANPDPVEALEHRWASNSHAKPHVEKYENHHQRYCKLMLCHYPTCLPTAADMGMDLMFSGHTHGGQCRLPWGRALANSCDLPTHLTSGIIRHQDTFCVVSRGLGENILPFRAFCPPHLPIYTLRQGPLLGKSTCHMVNVVPW